MEMTEFLLLFGSMSGLLHVSKCLQSLLAHCRTGQLIHSRDFP